MGLMEVWVLRLSHRVMRDVRVTSHVALAARAFGAKGMYFSGDFDENIIKTIGKVTSLWGGGFKVQYVENPLRFARSWKSSGEVVHLTMYGLPIRDVIGEIRRSTRRKLVVVGSRKVPREMYLIADWNVSVTNQPHSEVSALAVFLHELFEGYELNLDFENAKLKIIPQPRGKRIVKSMVNS
ncbi:MAG: tRNA (cytidine(56)-2'-O)-methyltransferase [Candidatus Methanomethylicia archaeon]